jgi:hypothetical protein
MHMKPATMIIEDGILEIIRRKDGLPMWICGNSKTCQLLNRLPFWYRLGIAYRLVLGKFNKK